MSSPQPTVRRGALGRALIECATQAGIGVIVTTSRTLEPKTVWVNDVICSLFGYSRDELLGQPTLRLAAPESLLALQEVARQLIRQRQIPTRLSTVGMRRDGARLPLHYSYAEVELGGEPYAVAFVIDLSTDERARAALRSSEERFQRLLECAPEAVWVASARGVRWANNAARQLFGVAAGEDIVGLDFRAFVHPEDLPRLDDLVARLLNQESVPSFEIRARRRDGTLLDLAVSAIAVDYEGEWAVLSFGRDVTEQRQLEVQLERSERLALLGTLAGGMAHGINNPLTYVLLNLDHLSRTLPQLGQQRALLSEIVVRLRETQHGAERVAAVVRRVRLFSRHSEALPGLLDVAAVLVDVLALLGNELRHRVQVQVESSEPPTVMGGVDRVEQLLLSLLVHALRTSPEPPGTRLAVHLGVKDGWVTVRLEHQLQGAGARVANPAPLGHHAHLPPALLACRRIAQALGGEVLVAGAPERAESFLVRLPSAAGRPKSSAPPGVSSLPPPTTGARLLVIDDDPGVASALEHMLADEHQVRALTEASRALERLLDTESWDVALCDLMMPELTGRDLYQALARERPGRERRLVFMTGGAFTPELARFLSEVDAARVEKPFDLAALRATLARVLRREAP